MEFDGHVGRYRHLSCMADQAETGYIGHGVNGESRAVLGGTAGDGCPHLFLGNDFGSRFVQRCHRAHGGVNPRRLSFAFLDRRGNHSSTKSLGENKLISQHGAPVGEDPSGMNEAGYRVSELRLFIADAMPADHGASGFDHF